MFDSDAMIARRLIFPPGSSSKKVFSEISDRVCVSKIRWRGRSSPASLPSDRPKARKSPERMSKDERRAMVESYVDRYRSLNSGKFPNASAIKKEVGGSYYTIRQIVQELQYKSKMTVDIDTHKAAQTVGINVLETDDSSCKHDEAKDEPQTSSAEPAWRGGDPMHIAPQSQLLESEAKEASASEKKVNENRPSEDEPDLHGSKSIVQPHQHPPEVEKSGRDMHGNPTGEKHQKKLSLWGNLKSAADGILNMWRKL